MDLDRSDNVILKAANQYGQMCQKGDLKNDFIIRQEKKARFLRSPIFPPSELCIIEARLLTVSHFQKQQKEIKLKNSRTKPWFPPTENKHVG